MRRMTLRQPSLISLLTNSSVVVTFISSFAHRIIALPSLYTACVASQLRPLGHSIENGEYRIAHK